VPRGVRAGTDAGRTRAAEGHGRRLIFRTRNRTDPISGCANNGDAPVRQALSAALQEFAGALVLVSHDRHLLRVTSDQLWLVDAGQVTGEIWTTTPIGSPNGRDGGI